VKAQEVERTIKEALKNLGPICISAQNLYQTIGPFNIAPEQKDYLKTKGICQVDGKMAHPQRPGARLNAVIEA
jgi:hypothetical protein